MELVNYYKKLLDFLSKLLKINDNLPYLVVGKNNKILYSEAKIPFEYEENKGRFYSENNILYINLDVGDITKYHDELFTIIYEFRRFYQLKQIEMYPDSCIENKEIVKNWKYNYENYIESDDNKEYFKQDIEIDASVFTIYIYETIYLKECFINADYPQEKCDKYYELFKNKYSKNDINLILNDINFEPLIIFNL